MEISIKGLKFAGCLTMLLLFLAGGCAHSVVFKQTNIRINNINLNVEYADSKKLRRQGLMKRTSLCDSCGMLFKFHSPKFASMWMKDTYIPLDIAFIKKNGIIVDIKSLKPRDLSSVRSSDKVLYALEMNQGWFAKNHIKVGDKVEIPSY